jgi:hypothetical protein
MKTLGIAVAMKSKPVLSFVLLDDHADEHDPEALTVEEAFEVPLEDRPLAAQLGEAAKIVRGRVRSLAPDAVVVRRADRPSHPSNKDGPRKRLLIEGAVTSAAYAEVLDTTLLTGKECGQAHGSSKASVDALARGLIQTKHAEAAAAALARLAEGRTPPLSD